MYLWRTVFGLVLVTAANGLAQTDTQPLTQAQAADMLSHPAESWIIGLLAAIVVLLGMGFVMFLRLRTSSLWIPPRIVAVPEVKPVGLMHDGARTLQRVLLMPDPAETAVADPAVEIWRHRALTAEATVGRQGDVIREKMIPELTEFAKQGLVQGLVEQRDILIETQLKAQVALTELEARMNTLQTPLQERIRVYEKRVAELEQAVETQGQEVRELTRATLSLVREKLAAERESAALHTRFN
jgi:hypothetical protein